MQESPEKANKVLAVQLEKNLKILEHDYNLMVFRIQSTMNKLTGNNLVLSELYQAGINQWCDSIDTAVDDYKSMISECEKLDDQLQSVEILSKKMMICEEALKNSEKSVKN